MLTRREVREKIRAQMFDFGIAAVTEYGANGWASAWFVEFGDWSTVIVNSFGLLLRLVKFVTA